MYIYVLIKFQQLEYHYEKKIFFQKMMNFLACLIPYYLAKSLYSDQYTYISTHIYRDRSHESWPEARRASGIVSRAKLISRMKTDENRIEDSMAFKYRRDRC